MLVLSRKIGEQIRISDCVTITINRIRGNRVLLGINAPQNVHIVRGELKPLSAAAENGQPATNGATHAALSPIPNLRSSVQPGGQHAASLSNETRIKMLGKRARTGASGV